MKAIQPVHLILGGSVLLIIGSVLNWVSGSMLGVDFSGSSGIGVDGKFSVVCGITVFVLAQMNVPERERLFVIISLCFAALGGLIGIYDLLDILEASHNEGIRAGMPAELQEKVRKAGGVHLSPGPGIFVVIAGGALAALGCYQRLKLLPATPAAPPPQA